MLNKSLKKKLTIVYAILLVLGGIFIYIALNKDYVNVEEKESSEKVINERFVDVELKIQNGQTYSTKMKNTHNVLDLLEKLRDDTNFSFERTVYTYGTRIDSVNEIPAPEDSTWAVFHRNENITQKMGKVFLKNDEIYIMDITHSEELQ